jgi:hypothetical protein
MIGTAGGIVRANAPPGPEAKEAHPASIRLAPLLYVKDAFGLRNVEDLLAEPDIDLSPESTHTHVSGRPCIGPAEAAG